MQKASTSTILNLETLSIRPSYMITKHTSGPWFARMSAGFLFLCFGFPLLVSIPQCSYSTYYYTWCYSYYHFKCLWRGKSLIPQPFLLNIYRLHGSSVRLDNTAVRGFPTAEPLRLAKLHSVHGLWGWGWVRWGIHGQSHGKGHLDGHRGRSPLRIRPPCYLWPIKQSRTHR